MTTAVMRDALLREQARLEGLLASLDRDWNNVPKLLLLTVLAIPVGIWLGAVWGVAVAVLVACLAGTVLYLVTVRRREYRHELDHVVEQLAARGDGS